MSSPNILMGFKNWLSCGFGIKNSKRQSRLDFFKIMLIVYDNMAIYGASFLGSLSFKIHFKGISPIKLKRI